MYFPYLRGKQFELLALKELSGFLGETRNVFPIIEPIRSPDGGLSRCLRSLSDSSVPYAVVANPNVGELRGELISDSIAAFVAQESLGEKGSLALLIHENTPVHQLLEAFEDRFGHNSRLVLVHKGLAGDLEFLSTESARLGRTYNVIDEGFVRPRYFRNFDSAGLGRVTLRDAFLRAERNADYLPREESDFTDDHRFYISEGWVGFGDYATIGEPYVEGGFTPRAVAIHWTYEPNPNGPIKIRSFVSEATNGDIANVGGKFLEAAGKLVAFLDNHNIHTRASEVMRQHFADGTYPGLGIVKKLSIQNHLELVSTILARPAE